MAAVTKLSCMVKNSAFNLSVFFFPLILFFFFKPYSNCSHLEVIFTPFPESFGLAWRHFWFPTGKGGCCYWCLVGKGQGCSKIQEGIESSPK